MWAARVVPRELACFLARSVMRVYRALQQRRLQVVTENLLPVFGGILPEARREARRLFLNFGDKLVDLWRWEAGVFDAGAVKIGEGRELFFSVLHSGKGVLLVTLHLGNWEFGAALLAGMGIKPLILTGQEPSARLTELRAASRALHGIETLVVGNDPFGFVEVIKRLNAGGVVAILLDRPPTATAVTVELFGRPFLASSAAADLARATGCAILPVCIVSEEQGYRANVFPAVDYDRAGLRSRENRLEITSRLVKTFEPSIRRHAAQWYHFVPVWPQPGDAPPGESTAPK